MTASQPGIVPSRTSSPPPPARELAAPEKPFAPTPTPAGCNFAVWAPNASSVSVIGDFNQWRSHDNPLACGNGGVWYGHAAGAQADQRYLFVIDNKGGDDLNSGETGLHRIDPMCRATDGSAENGMIVDVAKEIAESGLGEDPFMSPPPQDWIVYQAHIGSFIGCGDGIDTGPTATGTFNQFQSKLEYIRSLGFNALALLPIQQNPGDGNEGYGPSHLFAIESSYGSTLELRKLVRAAHDVGLAVLFDVVWNHISDYDNRLWDFDGMNRDGGIYFEDGERSPWGPRLAFWKAEIRDFVLANARAWLDEYHVDGLRVDAANEISHDVLLDVVRCVREDERHANKLMIAEWTGDDLPGWDAQINSTGFDRVWSLADPYRFRHATLDAGESPASRTAALLDVIALPNAGSRVRYLLGSHDDIHDSENGAITDHRYFVELAGGRDNPYAQAKARLGWALCATLPGTPMCFMGSECHHSGYWHPRTDQNPVTGDHRFNWAIAGDPIGMQMRSLVTAVNRVRWERPVLRVGQLDVVHVDQENGVVIFARSGDDPPMLVVVNISDQAWRHGEYRIPVYGEYGLWRVVLDSSGDEFGGSSVEHHDAETQDGTISIAVAPWSVLMLEPTA